MPSYLFICHGVAKYPYALGYILDLFVNFLLRNKIGAAELDQWEKVN